MTTSISYDGGATIRPTLALIETAALTSAPRTVVHDILDGPPVHTLRPASPTRGTLALGFVDETAATDCLRAHQLAAVFTITSDENALVNFQYVVTGADLRIELDEESRAGWIVRVSYQAVV